MNVENLVVVLGAVAGALTGCISFLFKALVESKDGRINELVDERDYWRDTVLGLAKLPGDGAIPSYEDWLKAHTTPEPTPPPKRPGKV